jgi:hypothetical protein
MPEARSRGHVPQVRRCPCHARAIRAVGEIPQVQDVQTPEQLGELAITVASAAGACLVLAPLTGEGSPTGDLLIVPDLPAHPTERARLFHDHVLYLYAATGQAWHRLAYAIVEHDGSTSIAYLRFAPRHPSSSVHVRNDRRGKG